MTMSPVSPGGGPFSALVALGQQPSQDGSGKDPSMDFAGLLSRLSAAVDNADPAHPPVKEAAIETMLWVQQNGQPAPSGELTHPAPENGGAESTQIARASLDETAVGVASDSSTGETDLLPVVQPDRTTPSTDPASSRDDAMIQLAQTRGQPEEILALLSSVMRGVPPDARSNLPQTFGKTAGQPTAPVQGARGRPGGESTALEAQAVNDAQGMGAQLPVDTAWQEPVQVSVGHLAGSMAPRGKDQGVSSILASDLKLSVLQTETHLAPVLHGGPMMQVAEGIRAEFAAEGETGLTWSPSDSMTAKPHADAPVKVLLIQLQPTDLGTVTVRMSLKEDTLHLHIEASQQETAQRLQQDQDSLSKVLRSAGYHIDGVAIRMAEPDRSVALPSQSSAPMSQSPHQETAGGAASEGSASQGRGHHEQAARGQARPDAPADANGQRQASPNGLYV